MTQMKHGRPVYVPTDKQRREVYDLAKWGFGQRDIARCLFISVPTLRRHFDEELHAGPARRKAEVIDMLWTSARVGKVRAQRQLFDMMRRVKQGW